MPTMQQLIEEESVRTAVFRIIIGGADIAEWTSLSYEFSIGSVPTATIVLPSHAVVPGAIAEEASVQIWFGLRVGISMLEKLVFGGAVVDSVGSNGQEVVVECVMDGPRKLAYSYNRRIDQEFETVTAEESVLDLLTLAGVSNYYVELDPWLIGTAVPQTIEFSTYGEAINKISEVYGSPWYALPTGQVRVEKRDPVPSESWHRTYHTGVLTGTIETNPTAVDTENVNAKPRINDITRREFRAEVANFIEVDGATVISLGPNGEQNSDQIFETVDGASGRFPNGAYWIPTPPLFQDFVFSNELIDTNAVAFEVAERYFALKNRLFEKVSLTVEGDPDVFLGETVRLVDPNYSGVTSLYFLEGYRTTVDSGGCTTDLSLTGGPESGTTGFAAPFAEFYWKYTALHNLIGGGSQNTFDHNLGPGADQASKLCEDLPADTGQPNQREDNPFIDKRAVIIGLDGRASDDFDGRIVSWEWTWISAEDDEHVLTGPLVTIAIDPDSQSSVEVTLVVTDDSARTGTITKTIYTGADYFNAPGGDDPTLNDTDNGGGTVNGPCSDPGAPGEDGTGVPGEDPDNPDAPNHDPGMPGACSGDATFTYVAAGPWVVCSQDNRGWIDTEGADIGVQGNFISVASGSVFNTQQQHGIFGTDKGEIVLTNDACMTFDIVAVVEGRPRIEVIFIDTQEMGDAAEGRDLGNEGGPDSSGLVVYRDPSAGVLTYNQAYQQCLAVGFDTTSAIIAVAIMMGESGLNSHPPDNINVGPPYSRDRGIAQINDFYHDEVPDICAYDTACAIGEMFSISSGGTDFTPWAVYNAGVYKQYLSAIQEAIGVVSSPGSTKKGTSKRTTKSLKVWAGTSDGRIYLSNDSGRHWRLFIDFNDDFPIFGISTPAVGGLWVNGGDTSQESSLVRIDKNKDANFISLQFEGDLHDAILNAGGGYSCKVITTNETSMLIGFNGGVNPTVWTSTDPLGNPSSWVSGGYQRAVTTAAPGFQDEFLVG